MIIINYSSSINPGNRLKKIIIINNNIIPGGRNDGITVRRSYLSSCPAVGCLYSRDKIVQILKEENARMLWDACEMLEWNAGMQKSRKGCGKATEVVV